MGTGLLADRRADDGGSATRGFGLTGESGREERFLQLVQPVLQAPARAMPTRCSGAYQEYQEKGARPHGPAYLI